MQTTCERVGEIVHKRPLWRGLLLNVSVDEAMSRHYTRYYEGSCHYNNYYFPHRFVMIDTYIK